MKSIREQAEETYPKTTATSDLCNEKFVKGANYVLECIEEVTNICFDEELRKVIEQLKK